MVSEGVRGRPESPRNRFIIRQSREINVVYYKMIKFCLDNDNAGITATQKLMKKYHDMGFHTQRIYYGIGIGKDLNEILCNYLKTEKLMPDKPPNTKPKREREQAADSKPRLM